MQPGAGKYQQTSMLFEPCLQWFQQMEEEGKIPLFPAKKCLLPKRDNKN